MRRIVFALALVAALTLSMAASALAVPTHQHYITTGNGETHPIAQGFCANEVFAHDDGQAHTALHHFHQNVHLTQEMVTGSACP